MPSLENVTEIERLPALLGWENIGHTAVLVTAELRPEFSIKLNS
jgi:hypothetical protein